MDDYKSCNMQIVAICEKLCDTPLINLRPNYAYDILELVNELARNMDGAVDFIIGYYQRIIQFIILVFEGFEFHMGTVNIRNV